MMQDPSSTSAPSVVVVSNGVRATRAAAIVVRGGRVVVVGARVGTARNLVLVAHSVVVGVVQSTHRHSQRCPPRTSRSGSRRGCCPYRRSHQRCRPPDRYSSGRLLLVANAIAIGVVQDGCRHSPHSRDRRCPRGTYKNRRRPWRTRCSHRRFRRYNRESRPRHTPSSSASFKQHSPSQSSCRHRCSSSVEAKAVVGVREVTRVAGGRVSTTGRLVLVTDAIFVSVIDAIAVCSPRCCWGIRRGRYRNRCRPWRKLS